MPEEVIQLTVTRDEFDVLAACIDIGGNVMKGKPAFPPVLLLTLVGPKAYNSLANKLKLVVEELVRQGKC